MQDSGRSTEVIQNAQDKLRQNSMSDMSPTNSQRQGHGLNRRRNDPVATSLERHKQGIMPIPERNETIDQTLSFEANSQNLGSNEQYSFATNNNPGEAESNGPSPLGAIFSATAAQQNSKGSSSDNVKSSGDFAGSSAAGEPDSNPQPGGLASIFAATAAEQDKKKRRF